jgi:molybdate transport system permease protein
MVLPPTVIGYYLLLVVGRESAVGRAFELLTGAPLVFTPAAAVLATLVAAAPFLVRAAQGGFEQVDSAYEDAARTLGRSEMAIFVTVTMPLAWRGILAGTTLCFARAMGEFGATLMLAGNIPGRTQTASLAVYDAVQTGDLRRALLLSLLLSVATGSALWLLTTVGRPRNAMPSARRR